MACRHHERRAAAPALAANNGDPDAFRMDADAAGGHRMPLGCDGAASSQGLRFALQTPPAWRGFFRHRIEMLCHAASADRYNCSSRRGLQPFGDARTLQPRRISTLALLGQSIRLAIKIPLSDPGLKSAVISSCRSGTHLVKAACTARGARPFLHNDFAQRLSPVIIGRHGIPLLRHGLGLPPQVQALL